ncbi:hypothetical protein GGR54DRAFT_645194 [Hypoxylon sp. NC1633]|nr:hypothetical protein GGR54DRAFT_645194 [Hypoxylon sp. NC1633]
MTSRLSVLWQTYKVKEDSAFRTLFQGDDYRDWSIQTLSERASVHVSKLTQNNICSIQKDLQSALEYQKTIAKYYDPQTSLSRKHRAFRSTLERVIALLECQIASKFEAIEEEAQ